MKLSQSSIEFLCSNQISLKDRNVALFEHIQHLIQQNKIEELKKLMYELNETPEIHNSLLKSALIMTEHVGEVQEIRNEVEKKFKQRMVS